MPIIENLNQENEQELLNYFEAYMKEIENVIEIPHKLHVSSKESHKLLIEEGIFPESVKIYF